MRQELRGFILVSSYVCPESGIQRHPEKPIHDSVPSVDNMGLIGRPTRALLG
jgi:hypothetical protein